MEIIRGLPKHFLHPVPVVTIGNFDGLHLGHQKIFRTVIEKAEELKGTPVAMTFDPHPVRVLSPERGLKLITTFDDKAKLIFRTGIKSIICVDFNKDFAHMDAEDFIKEIIVERLNAKWVIVGHNYNFGRAKKGDTELLRLRGKKYGFGVSVVRYAEFGGEPVSSSRVRHAVLAGKVGEVSEMLGRAYHIDGVVVKGAGRGASMLNTPTANIATENELIPKEGVYAVRVSLDDQIYDGVANLGKNPTFKEGKLSYEVHIFNFNQNLLGRYLRVYFIGRIREEKKFSCIEDLFEHIQTDIAKAREILSTRKPELF